MPSNSHVLVPWKSLFHGYLLHICFCSHFAGELAVIPENHHLFWVCCTDVSVLCSGLQEQCLLLAVMAYDHYVAICKPLRYPIIMNRQVCVQMATVSWVMGSLIALLETSFALQIPLWEFHPSLQVRNSGSAEASLHKVIAHGHDHCGGQCAPSAHSNALNLHLLCHHPFQYSENQLSRGKKQSFFYLGCSLNCGVLVLWGFTLHVRKAFFVRLTRNR